MVHTLGQPIGMAAPQQISVGDRFQRPSGGISQQTVQQGPQSFFTDVGGAQQQGPQLAQQPFPGTSPIIQPTAGTFVPGLGQAGQPIQGPERFPQQLPVAPPTGLIGAEQALFGGGQAATGTIARAGDISGQALATANQLALQRIQEGQQGIQGATQQGLTTLNEAFQQAVDPVTGFIDPGQRAQTLQAARLGALGPEAQAEAIRQFQESPGQAFLREEQERAITRNAAALGGLGGGRVRQELQRQAAGRAAQQFDIRTQQLGGLAAQGLSAAGVAGGLQAQRGLTGAQLLQTGGLAQADLSTQAANVEQTTGINVANLAQQTGLNIADIVNRIGGASADLRTQAGRDIAQAIGATTTGVAGLQQVQGAGLSEIAGQTGTTLANSLLQQGLLDADATRQLATLLSNIGVEGATAQAALSSDVAKFETAGVLGLSDAAQEAIKGLGDIFAARKGKTEVT